VSAGGKEIDAVKMLYQSNNITADSAVSAVENLFLGIDRETINATAFRAWADTFGAVTL
jgi:hypothetical protein